VVGDRLIVFRIRDAAPLVTLHDLDGRFERTVSLPPLATVWGPGGGGPGFLGRRTDGEAFFTTTSFADAGTVYRLNVSTGAVREVLAARGDFDPADYIGERVFYQTKDGTRIPMFVARRRDAPLDGTRPVLMYGYGALGWPAFPWFQPQVLAWLDAGGIYALPCIRGGGEYGEAWHQAGRRERRQTTIDDYVAAAEWLVAQKYAHPGQVIANGGSLSGLVAAAAVQQHPETFGAALIDIPVLDLLRYERVTGAAAWIDDLGSAADPAQFAALRALPPYHNVKEQRCATPTLVTAGERDQTAAPWHAYKYVAALQHSSSCDRPVLLQVAWGAGHTFGATPADARDTWSRQLAFLAHVVPLREQTAALRSAQTPPPQQMPRCDGPEYRQFDFWVGEWDLRPANQPEGPTTTNVITKEDDGCVIRERWNGGKMTGQSVNIYDRSRGKWHQTWVDSTGGLHEYWGTRRSDGAMAFEGELPPRQSGGARIPTRMTFFELGEDKLRQLSEQSTDGGKTWTVGYDFIYTRKKK
jgi:dienelactone hydrolase